MLLEALEFIRLRLEGDADLTALLSVYETDEGNLPAIAFQIAPPDMLFPYIVGRMDSNTDSGADVVDDLEYCIDIFTDNGDITTAVRIANRIRQLLHRERMGADIGIGVWQIGSPLMIPEPDPGVQHMHIRFQVRHFAELII